MPISKWHNDSIEGTAVNGSDYNSISNFVLIPAGASSAITILTPKDDSFAEGTESISLSLSTTASYNVGPGTNAFITLLDDEPPPPALNLRLATLPNAGYALTVAGAATRIVEIDVSSDLRTWQPLTTMLNATGMNTLFDVLSPNDQALFFRARQVP